MYSDSELIPYDLNIHKSTHCPVHPSEVYGWSSTF